MSKVGHKHGDAIEVVRREIYKGPASAEDVREATRLAGSTVKRTVRQLAKEGVIVVWAYITDTKVPYKVWSAPHMTQEHLQ